MNVYPEKIIVRVIFSSQFSSFTSDSESELRSAELRGHRRTNAVMRWDRPKLTGVNSRFNEKKKSAWASTLKFKSIHIDFLHIMKYTERKENQFHNALENNCNYVNCLKCWLALKRKVACFKAPLILLESIPAENSEGLLFTCMLPDFSKLSQEKKPD